MSETLHPIVHDIPKKDRSALVKLLNARLADTFDLYGQLKQAHWNVKGIHFMPLHLLFDQVAEAVEPFVDEIAERITSLGGTARGTVRMAAGASSLDEYPVDAVDGATHLGLVRDRLASYAAVNRKAIADSEKRDMATADLFTEIQRVVDKMLYFVQSHLPGD